MSLRPLLASALLLASVPAAAESCLSLIAAASPAGPAPTTTTSNSIASRGGISSSLAIAPSSYVRISPFGLGLVEVRPSVKRC